MPNTQSISSRNPFKFGTIVADEFFTDRQTELRQVSAVLRSENHLVLISPRRFGKSSLVMKAVAESRRPVVTLNLQSIVSTDDFAAHLLRAVFRLYPWERIKHLLSHFRVVPTISTNPVTESVDIAFQPTVDTRVVLEDALTLLARVTTPERRLIVVMDEFQEIAAIDKRLPKLMRAVLQQQTGLNYIFLGSQETMMEEIFEQKKSPFYHFGQLMRLGKIPCDDFREYIVARLPAALDTGRRTAAAHEILAFTASHPYYTQQLAALVWDMATRGETAETLVAEAIERLTLIHDLDYERLWTNFNRTDRRTLRDIALAPFRPATPAALPTSTTFSSLKRLLKAGHIIRTDTYQLEDPFFRRWIANSMR